MSPLSTVTRHGAHRHAGGCAPQSAWRVTLHTHHHTTPLPPQPTHPTLVLFRAPTPATWRHWLRALIMCHSDVRLRMLQIWNCGQSVALIDDLPSCKELVERLLSDAHTTLTTVNTAAAVPPSHL